MISRTTSVQHRAWVCAASWLLPASTQPTHPCWSASIPMLFCLHWPTCPPISALHHQHFKVTHSGWVGQCGHTIANIVPLQQRDLALLASAPAIHAREVALAYLCQFVVDPQLLQPCALRCESMEPQTLTTHLVNQRAEIDVCRNILLTGAQ